MKTMNRLPQNEMAKSEHRAPEPLEKILLELGGEKVCCPFGREPNLDELLAKGQPFRPNRIRKSRGRRNRCHLNAVIHYLCNQHFGDGDMSLCTGYARKEGIWRQHSWLWNGQDIVETTVKNEIYWGCKLEGKALTMEMLGELMNGGLLPGSELCQAGGAGQSNQSPKPRAGEANEAA